ncbi:MAG: hypothetical protein O2786_07355 [archaeon]|nr:hypothetical protein [archaeon]
MDVMVSPRIWIRKAYTDSPPREFMLGRRTMTSCIFLMLLFCIGTVSSAPAEVVSEEIVGYESQNSPEAVNIERARDGVVGVSNQAQIKAQACDSDDSACTEKSFAGLEMNFQMDASETLISINMTYESFGEVDPFGDEADPSGYAMYVEIEHKFGLTSPILIETSTTGYDAPEDFVLGNFAPYANGTILFRVYLEHTDTNSFSDEATARVHEIWTNNGPTDSDADGVSDTSDSCPNTTNENRPNVGEDGCLQTVDDDVDDNGGTDDVDDNGGTDDVDDNGGIDDVDDNGGTDDVDDNGGTDDVDSDGGADDTDSDGVSDNIDEGKTDFFHEVTDFTDKHRWIRVVGPSVLAGLSWIATNRFRKGKGRTAKKFFRLAKAAEDLAEVARIQESIDDLLADGAMDGPVHQNVSKLLSERKKILLNRMNKISDPNLSK